MSGKVGSLLGDWDPSLDLRINALCGLVCMDGRGEGWNDTATNEANELTSLVCHGELFLPLSASMLL